MSLRVRVQREANHSYENERKEARGVMKEYRKKHRADFWETQTQAENMWIDQFRTERNAKVRADMHH